MDSSSLPGSPETPDAAAPRRESLVGLMVDQGPDVLVGMLGTLAAGRGFVPVDPQNPEARLGAMLRDRGVRVLLTDRAHRAKAQRLREHVPTLEHVVCLDDLDDGAPDTAALEERERAAAAIDPDGLAYSIFTSGSTGTPKGVGISHRNLAPMLAWAEDALGLGEHTKALQTLSYWFDFGVFEQLTTVLAGGTLHVLPEDERTDPARFGARAKTWGIDTIHGTPSFARALAHAGVSLPALRTLHLGGEALTPEHIETLHEMVGDDTVLYNGYGPTEATINTTIFDLGSRRSPHHRAHARMPIGRPSANHRVYIVDPKVGQPVPSGVPGELLIGGPLVARGYLGRAALTAERFLPDPFGDEPGGRLYATGDLVRFLPDGNIAFLGRIDHQIKLRGFRIELGEIEAALQSTDGVAEAVAGVRDGRPGDPRLFAWVTAAEDRAVDGQALRESLRGRLPEYMVPSAIAVLEAMPVASTGKIDLRALPTPAVGGDGEGRAPSGPVESQLAALFADVLGLETVLADDDFFALGGHSLLATQLIGRIREALGAEIPLLRLFEAPSVAALATEVEQAWSRGDDATEADDTPIVAVERRPEGMPLSPAQERLWILDRFDPGTAAYNMPMPLRLRGVLDRAALQQALDTLVRRHEGLRTTFTTLDGAPRQYIHPPAAVALPAIDLTAGPIDAREAELEKAAGEEARTPFDLGIGPLFRATLVRLDDSDHALLLNLHHVIADGWSIGVLIRELGALYDAFRRRGPSPLPEPALQYADYAAWQRDRLAGPVAERQIAYWRERLGDRPPASELPLDRPRPPVQSYRGARVTRRPDAALGQALEAVARRRNASLFMVLLAAWKLLLARWSGHQDVVVGTPIAGRTRAATENLIGIFLNTLVLRTDLAGVESFDELVDRVREVALGAFAHQDVPFEMLLDALRPARDLGRTPLFQVFFNMLNLPRQAMQLEDLVLEAMGTPELPSKFDLTLYAGAGEDGRLGFTAVYNADLFDADRIEALLDQYVALLEHAAKAPEASIATLDGGPRPAMLPSPRMPLLAIRRRPVHQTVARRAAAEPSRAALIDADGAWTYGELGDAVARLAGWLERRGIGRGAPVAILAQRSAALPAAMLGVLSAGAAFVILDPAYPPGRLAEIAKLAGARALLQIGDGPLPEHLRDALDGRPTMRLATRPRDFAAGESPLATRPVISGDDLAYLAFTSGSTGRPKGIRGRHAPLAHYAAWMRERFALGGADRAAMLSGLAHDPLLRDVFPTLAAGATLCIPDPARMLAAGYLAGWLRETGVTVANLTPAMGRVIAMPSPAADAAPSGLRLALFVGEALRRGDLDRLRPLLPSATMVNLYGATETQQALAHHVLERDQPSPEVAPLGVGIDGVQVLVLAADDRLAAVGEVGEIHLRSPYLAAGYLDGAQDADVAGRFRPNPFIDHAPASDRLYRTGDLGRYRPDGVVTFAGRRDDQVKIRGFRIEPAEVEARLRARDEVSAAAVVVTEDDTTGAALVAFAVPGPGTAPSAETLRTALRQTLPPYMVPAAVVLVDALPVTPNGKLDREDLHRRARRARRSQESPMAYAPPTNELERTIAELLRDVLEIERVGADDNFFELGGNSLLLVKFHQKLHERTGHDLQPVDIFNHPTPRSLAAFLQPAGADGAPASEPKRDDQREQQLKVGRARLQQQRLRARKAGRDGSRGNR